MVVAGMAASLTLDAFTMGPPALIGFNETQPKLTVESADSTKGSIEFTPNEVWVEEMGGTARVIWSRMILVLLVVAVSVQATATTPAPPHLGSRQQ
jgi:hypothetical protein